LINCATYPFRFCEQEDRNESKGKIEDSGFRDGTGSSKRGGHRHRIDYAHGRGRRGPRIRPVRSFGTFTADLHRLADRFAECGIKTIVMESTSVYWIPIYELLDERGFEVFLVNARDAKHVPGRKTDVSDAQWLQRLHSHGLLRASFRPKGEIIELRAYLRQRERLLDTAASQIQHMQKAMTEIICSFIMSFPM
jgi:transposase